MRKEREIAREKEEAYWKALERYQKMLDYYKISPEVQKIVVDKILALPPEKAIEEINKYWEDYLKDKGEKPDDNHNENDSLLPQSSPKSPLPNNQKLHWQNLQGLSPAQRKLYEYRRGVTKGIYETNRGKKK